MTNSTVKPYSRYLQTLMAEKTAVLSKAKTLTDMGMEETAQPLWASAASYEERIGPLLESLGRTLEAAVHRISAASCFQKAGDLSRAANLYQAALAGPLKKQTRREVEQLLADCLAGLTRSSRKSDAKGSPRKVATKV